MNRKILSLMSPALALGFLLGIHEGRVALWRDGEPRPEQIYDIRAESREKVWLLLENYFD